MPITPDTRPVSVLTRREIQHPFAWPLIAVSGGIAVAKVGFDFDDAARQQLPALAPDEQLAQQVAGHHAGIAIVEGGRQRACSRKAELGLNPVLGGFPALGFRHLSN